MRRLGHNFLRFCDLGALFCFKPMRTRFVIPGEKKKNKKTCDYDKHRN